MKKLLLFLLLSAVCLGSMAQQQLGGVPSREGDRARYSLQIDIRRAYVSGILSMLYEDGIVKAAVVNEFGVSALSFTYNPRKNKVKLLKVLRQLDHWYIRRVLRKDLLQLLQGLAEQGCMQFVDEKYNITYTLTDVPADETQE